jgi:PHD/YefM family antitoxin component YafN of YafNO toxin-antitoxin module
VITLTANKARINLHNLIEEVASSHKSIRIASKQGNVVLISEKDWLADCESMHLLSIPGMRTSIHKGLKTPLSKCSKTAKW